MPEPLEEIQDAILDRLHAGEVPDRAAILAAHPEHRDSLARFLDLLGELESTPPPVDPADPASLGEFRILRELGRGGMGIVYEAEQASLKRRVALKVLPPSLGRDPKVVARFRREAEAAGRLRHPNIVPVFSVGETGGTPFFAMELVEGRSIADAVRDRIAGKDVGLPAAGEPWRRWVVETVARVADALHYAHGQGILHRDVKPANILLENSGVPRLTDFGLAMDLAAPGLTATGETFGTPLYMSPEQALRRETPLDPRTDVYSLGVTLYEALTLRTPYEGNSTPEILTALHQGRIVAPRTADPSMPEPLERIVLQALRKAPADRYETAGVFAADLRNWLASRPIEAVPPPPAPPAAKPEEEPEPAGYERHLNNAFWYIAVGGPMIFGVLAMFGWLPVRWSSKSSQDGSESAAVSSREFTPAELLLLADGKLPEGEQRLAAWLRPQVRMRNVIARSSLGKYQCRVDRGVIWNEGKAPYRVRVFGRFETSVDRGPWKEIPGSTCLMLTDSIKGTSNLNPALQDVLGDAVKNGSVNLRHRARFRIVPWDPKPIGAKDDSDAVYAAFARPGGTTCTWEDERTLVVYDDYPEGYPESIRRQDVDGAMLASLTPTHWSGLNGSTDGEFGLTLMGLPEPGPLAVAYDVDWLHPESGAVLGTTTLDREARDPAVIDEPNTTWGLGLLFPAPESPNPEREDLARKITGGTVRTVRLRFRPSREYALEKTTFERIWGRSIELVVPAESGDPKKKSEVRILEPQLTVSVSMDGAEPETFTRSALQRLLAGKPRAGDPSPVAWVDAHADVPSMYSLKEGFGPRYQYPCRVELKTPKSAETGEPGEDVLVLTLWERALGSGPWTELGFTASTLAEGRGELQASFEEIREAYRAGASASIRHRAKIHLLPRPEGWKELRKNLSEAWKLPAAASFTHNQANAVDIVETYPESYPAVVRGKTEEEEAGMIRAVTPREFEFGGKSSDFSNVFLHGVLHEIPGGGFAPAAFEVDLYFEGDGVPVATGRATIPRSDPVAPPHPFSQQIAFSKPKTPENESAFEAARKRFASGEVKSVRLVFRSSRSVAIQTTDWERTWGGTVDVVVPVRPR
jgi:serine/threonine protein kinase